MTASRPPRFSVVIPVRDEAEHLPRALASVFDQSFGDLELVVVDDGSTDATPRILDQCQEPRLRVLRQDARGVSAARNAGLRMARGEWVTFLDGDDEALPGWLEALAAEAAQPSAGILCCGVSTAAKQDGGLQETTVLPEPGRGLFHHQDVLFLAGSFAARRELLEDVGGYAEALAYAENTELGIRLVEACASEGLEVRSIARPLVRYHLRDAPRGERATANAGRRLEAVRYLLDHHREPFARDRTSRETHLALAGVLAARIGSPREARRYFLAALRMNPTAPRHYARLLVSLIPRLSGWLWGGNGAA